MVDGPNVVDYIQPDRHDRMNASSPAASPDYSRPDAGVWLFAYPPHPAPVPVPPTVWLFGTGLLGFIGVGRRKHQNRTNTQTHPYPQM